MLETQKFRLFGENDIEEIPCRHIDGHYIVYWDDIEQVFPRIRQVRNGKVTITLMRDSKEIR